MRKLTRADVRSSVWILHDIVGKESMTMGEDEGTAGHTESFKPNRA